MNFSFFKSNGGMRMDNYKNGSYKPFSERIFLVDRLTFLSLRTA